MSLTEFLGAGISAPLGHDKRQSRFGVAYLRAIASQAGCKFTEEAPDEDVDAVDCYVSVGYTPIPVQVKSSRTSLMGPMGSAISDTAKTHWIARWTELAMSGPVYFVVVTVPPANANWLGHHANGTQMQQVAAYWTRIDPVALIASPTIHVPRTQRLDAATFATWRAEQRAMFTP